MTRRNPFHIKAKIILKMRPKYLKHPIETLVRVDRCKWMIRRDNFNFKAKVFKARPNSTINYQDLIKVT